MIIPYKDTNLKVYKDRIVLSKNPTFRKHETGTTSSCSEGMVFLYGSGVTIVQKDQIEKDGVTILGMFPNVKFAQYFIEADDAKLVESPKLDHVDHPNHYQSSKGLEVIDVIDAFTEKLIGVVAFDIGCAIKYMCRWKKKGGTEDLRKAIWYLEHAIKKTEEEENGSVHSGEDK